MYFATTDTFNSPQTTKLIVLVVASVMTVGFGTYFVRSYLRNQRAHGPLTRTENSLNRGHAVVIMGLLFVSMALAVGSVLSPTVRDALSVVGDHSRVIPLVLAPLVLAYVRWLTKKMAAIHIERARSRYGI